MKKLILLLLSFLLSFTGIIAPVDDLEPIAERIGSPTEENMALFEKIFKSETAWLASLQLENGAIPMTYMSNGEVKMNPYFADIAALALLDNSNEYSENVIRYMDWHFSHLNTESTDHNGIDGTIYDYIITLENGNITDERISVIDGRNTYDSVDSYAATFLSVLNKYYQKTADIEYILNHKNEIERIVNAMFSTLHRGLSTAKPEWQVKYLMDNAEVYEGALAAAELFEKVLCPSDPSLEPLLQKCLESASEIPKAIEKELWMPLLGYYEVGYRKGLGFPSDIFSWDKYYPCATAQLYPIIYGIIAPNTQRANKLYDRFSKEYDWQNFNYPDVFYWGSNLQAAVRMNDIASVVTYLKNYEKLTDDHAYPLYNADAARVCLAVNELLEKY